MFESILNSSLCPSWFLAGKDPERVILKGFACMTAKRELERHQKKLRLFSGFKFSLMSLTPSIQNTESLRQK